MNRKHAITISLAAGLAAIAGTVAATKSIRLAHPAAPAQASSALIAQRSAALDRAERALHKALAQKPPKLPPLPAAVSGPPPAATPAQPSAPRVVYVRPAPHIVTIHRAGGGEHEGDDHEAEGGHGGEGGFDD